MANNFSTTTKVADMSTDFFYNLSTIVATCNDYFQKEMNTTSMALGGQLLIKIPGYPNVQRGLSVTSEGIQDSVIPYTVTEEDIRSTVYNVNIYEQKFDIVNAPAALVKTRTQTLIDNYAFPAAQSINADLELDAAFKLNVNTMYTPIDTVDKLSGVNSFASVAQLQTFFNSIGFPKDDRSLMFNLSDAQLVATSQQNAFNPSRNEKITQSAFIGGSQQKGMFAGFDAYQSEALSTVFQAGALAGMTGITISSVSGDGTQVTLAGVPSVTSKLINAGDMIAVTSVQLLHRVYKTPQKYTLVLKAFTNSNGNGDGTVTVNLPYPLMSTGWHAWINAMPANGAAVQVFPNRNDNFAYTKSGMSLVTMNIADIAGAINSDETVSGNSGEGMASKSARMKVVTQGSNMDFANNFRIAMWAAVQPFTPYIAALPSAA
jgi:hypothetical protein